MHRASFFVLVLLVAILFNSAEPNHSVVYSFGEISSTTSLTIKPDEEVDDSLYTEIVLTGDILLARKVEFYMRNYGDYYPFERIGPFLNNQFVIANFEATVPKEHVPTAYYKYAFSVDKIFLDNLDKFGIKAVNLANNHSLDFGDDAFLNTKFELSENKVASFGNAKTLDQNSVFTVLVDGQKISVLALNLVDTDYQVELLKETLEEMSKHSDKQFAYLHWGEEYSNVHNQKQEKMATWLVENGVDLIVGHHPHVVQDIQVINGVPVFYSLGNFIFDQYFSNEVQNGILLKVRYVDNEPKLSLIPITSLDKQSSPRLMNEVEISSFWSNLKAKSSYSLQGDIDGNEIQLSI